MRGHTGVVLDEQLLTTTQGWIATQDRVRIKCWQEFEGSRHLELPIPLWLGRLAEQLEVVPARAGTGYGKISIELTPESSRVRGEGARAPSCREAAAKVRTPVLAPRTVTILAAASRAN